MPDYLDDESKLLDIVKEQQKELQIIKEEREQAELEERSQEFLNTFVTKEDFSEWAKSFAEQVGESMQKGFEVGLGEIVETIQKGDGNVSDKVTPNTQKKDAGSSNKLPSDQSLNAAYDQKPDEKNSASGPGNDGGDEQAYVLKESDKKEDKKDDEKDVSGDIKDVEDKIKSFQGENPSVQKAMGSGTPTDTNEDEKEKEKDEKQSVSVNQDPLLSKQSQAGGTRNFLLEAARAVESPVSIGDGFDDGLSLIAQGSSVFDNEEMLQKEITELAKADSQTIVQDASNWLAKVINKEEANAKL